MKMIFVVADEGRSERVGRELLALGARGYTSMPVLEGVGHTGMHAGDRVHPGALVSFFAVAEDDVADQIFDGLVRCRDSAGDCITRLFLLPVERMA